MPTWRGCLSFLVIFALLAVLVGRHLHSFLALNETVSGGVMAVEGWGSDYAMEQAVVEFRRGHYEKVYVTGGPLEWGAPLAEYKTYAQRGAAVLLKLGLATNLVQAVPAPAVRADRTYTAGIALGKWVRENHVQLRKVQLISEGPHARRSRLLLAKALGPEVQVGVTAVPVQDYDPNRWWRSSAGVRGVIGELLAYGYAKFLFGGGSSG